MLRKCTLFVFISLYIFHSSFAQKTHWASQVLEFSSERIIPFQITENKAVQALDKPNVYPKFTKSTAVWQSPQPDSLNSEYITVSFDTIMSIRQVAIVENYERGAIDQILAVDENKNYHTLYQYSDNQPIQNIKKGEIWHIFLENLTPYSVVAIKLILNTERIKGVNQIDAIAISESIEPIKPLIKIAKDAQKEAYRENLGKNINSRHQEFAPIISLDGKTLFFTRNYLPVFWQQKKIFANEDMDVWYSNKDIKGNWGKAHRIGLPINDKGKNAIFSVSADGKEIFLLNNYKKNTSSNIGISHSFLTSKGWSYPEEIKFVKFDNYSHYCDITISPNGAVMVMSIMRPSTIGRRDLYVSFKKNENLWSEPINMGRQINTNEDDASPFIAADGKTLYYSTQGFTGYGNNDIYKTERLDNSWFNWSEPENLGPAINTAEWDAFFTIPASGEYAYVCSSNASRKEDIYRLELPKTAKPESVAIISGNVVSTTDKKTVVSIIKMTPQNDKLKPEVKNYDPVTGLFSFVVPLKEIYDFVPYAKGYLGLNETIDLSKEISYREIKKDFYLMPLEVGNKGVLNSFTFEQGESKLQAPALKDLDRIVQAMLDFPTLEIFFEGHTDNQGDFQLNLKLSEERLEEVKHYLISKSVPAERITSQGWGQTRPIASNATEERRKLNRRVEFTIVKK